MNVTLGVHFSRFLSPYPTIPSVTSNQTKLYPATHPKPGYPEDDLLMTGARLLSRAVFLSSKKTALFCTLALFVNAAGSRFRGDARHLPHPHSVQ